MFQDRRESLGEGLRRCVFGACVPYLGLEMRRGVDKRGSKMEMDLRSRFGR